MFGYFYDLRLIRLQLRILRQLPDKGEKYLWNRPSPCRREIRFQVQQQDLKGEPCACRILVKTDHGATPLRFYAG